MPTYEYRCDTCDRTFDVVQSFDDDPLTRCPTCDSPVRKVFGSIGIVFKGSGFYKTDSRNGSTGGRSSDKTGSASESSGSTDGSGNGSSSDGAGAKSDGANPAPKSGSDSKAKSSPGDGGHSSPSTTTAS